MEMSDQVQAPIALLAGKEPQYPSDRTLVEPQRRCGCCGEEKISYSCRESNPDFSVAQLVAISTELSRHLISSRFISAAFHHLLVGLPSGSI
jgi:hypothetical protein